MRPARVVLMALLCVAALFNAAPARADAQRQVAEVIAAYYQSAALENLETYLALQRFAPGERERTARFARALWAKVGSRDVRLGPVRVVFSPQGDRAVASYTVEGTIVNKATGESFRKKSRCMAVLVKSEGWKVDRVLPELIFKDQLREASLRYYARRLLARAGRPAPPAAATASGEGPAAGATSPPGQATPPAPAAATDKPAPARGYVVEVNSGEVVIDLGGKQGIKSGDRFQVVRVKQVKHPVTGKSLTWRQEIAVIQVKETQDQLSIATTIPGGDDRPSPGDHLLPLKKP